MESAVHPNPPELEALLARAVAGDQNGLSALFAMNHDRLRRMVALRLDPRLQGRVDPSDVLQDTYLQAAKRLKEYVNHPDLPFFLWLRFLTANRLGRTHREHLGAQKRNPNREISLNRGHGPAASSEALARHLLGDDPRPSQEAFRAELRQRIQDSLDMMDILDREVLALRHFEQLSRAEVAALLDITEAAAAKRYLRALARLKCILEQFPGGLEALRP
jgi:RNA polymerase sigma-70 factor (ECF subfamily)